MCVGNTCVCDTTTECDGLECGTGVCGGDCTNTCDSGLQGCNGNTCESNRRYQVVNLLSACTLTSFKRTEETLFSFFGTDFAETKEIASSVDLTSGNING